MKQAETSDTFRDLLYDSRWQRWKWRITYTVWHEMIKKITSTRKQCCIQVLLHVHAHFVMYSLETSYYGSLLTTVFSTESRRALRILTVYCMVHTQTPTEVHVLSLTPVDPNKSPLYPSIQGLRDYPQAGAYTCVSCLTTNLYAWGGPPTELISPSSSSWAASLPSSPLTALTLDTSISFALAMVFHSLNSHLGTVIMTWSYIYMCHVKTHSTTTLRRFIYPLKKLNYEWMSHWIIHVHPSAANK